MRPRPALPREGRRCPAAGRPIANLLLVIPALIQAPGACAARERAPAGGDAPPPLLRDFYVSPSGADAGPGSLAEPWRTLDRVNGESFQAGDRIHLEGGETFPGTLRFGADDAGSPSNPIVVDSYGAGRAVIDAGAGAGIDVYNTAGIEIRGLVVRGGWDAAAQSGNDGSGISIYTDLPGAARLEHVRIEGVEVSGFRDSGIVVGAWPSDGSMSGFRDVEITRCDSHDNGDAGISTYGFWPPDPADYPHRDLAVRRCRVWRNRGIAGKGNNSGNGIVVSGVDGALIELSEAYENGDLCDHRGGGPIGIWAWEAANVLIQSCESHHNRTGAVSLDGGGFDLDGGVTDSVIQYCYSHDNDGAGYLMWQFDGATPPLGRNTIRYSISQNDGRAHAYGAIHVGGGGDVRDNAVHGNTLFVSPAAGGNPSGVVLAEIGPGNSFRNNAVVTTGGVRLLDSSQAYDATRAAFQGNLWYAGPAPGDFRIDWGGTPYPDLASWRATGQETHASADTGIQADPLFNGPGGGGTVADPDALADLDAYRPLPGSPVEDAGLDLGALFGTDPGPRDYAGASLPQGSGLDIGALEAVCPRPGRVGDTLRVGRTPEGLLLGWTDIPGASSYNAYRASDLPSAFPTPAGSAPSGDPGLRIPMPGDPRLFFLVAGANACGEGPKD